MSAAVTDFEAAARDWVDGWTRGWQGHTAEPITSLYADDAVFRSHPLREPESPRAYVERAFSEEDEAEFRFAEPVVAGNRAAVEYWAVITTDGREETLHGVAVLRFAADGRVAEQRDYWSMAEGRQPPRWD